MPESLYRTIAADLRHRIRPGEMRAGSQLPNSNTLWIVTVRHEILSGKRFAG